MNKNQPIFASIFNEQWNNLPPVFYKHYANRPYGNDVTIAEGTLDITFNWLVSLMTPFLRIFGALAPYQGSNIPVTVHSRSEPDSSVYCLDRMFHFPDKKPYKFCSRLMPLCDDVVIEFMKYGIGWKHRFYYDGKKVVLEHRGYVLKLFGTVVPIPLGLFLGRGYAEEEATSDTGFRMQMTLTHPLFGKLYDYRGHFEMVV